MVTFVFLFVLSCALINGVTSVNFKSWWNKAEAKCGVEASTSLVHHNPWLVYIEYWRGDTDTDIRCAGTLIDSKHIITAAHCVRTLKFSRLVARLGEYDLYAKEDCVRGVCADPVVRINVANIIVHPGYGDKAHDIAILTLEEDAPYTDFIRPICLPSGDLQQDTEFYAAGWGEIPNKGYYAHVKKMIRLPYWSREECQKAYQHNHIPEHVICAGGEEGIDTCRGDSGGPLTLVKDTIELWGVTSHGNVHCGTKDSPGIYTNVAEHMDWIQMVIESYLVARLGEYDLYAKEDCVRGVCADPVVRINVANIIVHPGYGDKAHDIAILTLEEDAPYTDFIRPICLPSGDLQQDTEFYAAGWGEIPNKGYYAHVKKMIRLPYWSREECQKAYQHNHIPEHVICAGGEEGIDTCRGDSGGPLTLVKDTIELWGVTSHGNVHCGTKDSPGIYTNVAEHMDWIQMVIES